MKLSTLIGCSPARYLVFVLGLTLLATLLLVPGAFAQDNSAAPPVATTSPNEVNSVARELWCPLCSGVRLDACELKACDQMKDVIAEKLSAGEDTQTIKNYFVQQYGPQVLGEPPLEGFNWLAWVLPVLVLVAGGFFVWSRARNMVRAPRLTAAVSDRGTGSQAAGDPYSQKLEEELKQYD